MANGYHALPYQQYILTNMKHQEREEYGEVHRCKVLCKHEPGKAEYYIKHQG